MTGRKPHQTKAERTREALLHAARRVFGERGYPAASVAEICRQADVANGTFYRYFEDKEQILSALVEAFQTSLVEGIQRAAEQAGSGKEALLLAYRSVLTNISQRPRVVRVVRGAESMMIDLHEQFRSSLAEALGSVMRAGIQAGELRPIDPETAAYGILGIIEFAAMRYAFWESGALDEGVLQTLDSMILFGFDSGKLPTGPTSTGGPRPAPSASDRQTSDRDLPSTKSGLLEAAEELFGEIGFHQTSVSAIAARAGVAQGTFYLYFPGKTEVFVELVREISRRFRREEQQALARLVDRRAIEREGFRTFFRFISLYRGAYRILRDAELVDPETGRWFYESIVKGYIGGLRRGMERGEIRALALEPLAYALLGIGHSIALWSLTVAPTQLVSEGMQERVQDLIEHGVAIYRG